MGKGFVLRIVALAALAAELCRTAPDAGARAADVRDGDSCAFVFSWDRSRIDGHRTGVTCPSADNVTEALGKVSGCRYYSPAGKVFRGGAAAEAAAAEKAAKEAEAAAAEATAENPEA